MSDESTDTQPIRTRVCAHIHHSHDTRWACLTFTDHVQHFIFEPYIPIIPIVRVDGRHYPSHGRKSVLRGEDKAALDAGIKNLHNVGSVEEVKCQSRLHRPPITFLRRKKKRTDAKGNKKKDDRRNKKRVCSLISYPSTIAFASCFPLEYPNSPAQQTSYNKLNATRVARCGERCKKT